MVSTTHHFQDGKHLTKVNVLHTQQTVASAKLGDHRGRPFDLELKC